MDVTYTKSIIKIYF